MAIPITLLNAVWCRRHADVYRQVPKRISKYHNEYENLHYEIFSKRVHINICTM